MKNSVLSLTTAALALSLTACGGTEQPENNIVAEDMNAMTNLQEVAPPEPAANDAAEESATEPTTPESAAPTEAPAKPTPAKTAPAKPAPARPKPEAAAESPAPDPSCLPEHRAAGHC